MTKTTVKIIVEFVVDSWDMMEASNAILEIAERYSSDKPILRFE